MHTDLYIWEQQTIVHTHSLTHTYSHSHSSFTHIHAHTRRPKLRTHTDCDGPRVTPIMNNGTARRQQLHRHRIISVPTCTHSANSSPLASAKRLRHYTLDTCLYFQLTRRFTPSGIGSMDSAAQKVEILVLTFPTVWGNHAAQHAYHG